MHTRLGILLFCSCLLSSPIQGALIGWTAELSTDFHDVSGTVTVVSTNQLRVENFTFDGQGIDVYFYLGAQDTTAAFIAGLEIGPQLVGTIYDGTGPDLTLDLPVGQSISDYGAISVWCVDVSVSFGSGTFQEAVPEPSTSLLALLGLGLLGRRKR